MTIFNAQQAQKSVLPKSYGAEEIGARVVLTDYSLRELVDFAMTNRPSVVSAALKVADARLTFREIAADAPLVSYSPWTSPKLGLSGGYSAASESSSSRLGWHTEGNAQAGLSLNILLYDFGRNESLAEAQAERVLSSELELVREGYKVFEEVSSAYFTLMANDALLEVALTNETEFAIHLEEAQSRLAAGEAQRLDVTRARLDLSQAREQTIAASNQVVTSGAELMRALGIDVSRGTRETVFPAVGHALSEVVRGFPHTAYGVDTAFSLARTNAPGLAVSRAQLRAAACAVDFAVADLMPSVSAEIGLGWADPLWAWHWGVSGVQSIFQGFRKVTAVDRAVVAMELAAANVDEQEQKLSLDLETAIAVRDNALKELETARVSVEAAKENLAVVKAQYHEGEASRVDFTDSVSDYARALGSRVTAFYKGQIAESCLFALIGRAPEYREEVLKEK